MKSTTQARATKTNISERMRVASDLKEARESLAYWKRQAVLRENRFAKVDAGARVLVWESQIKTLEAKQSALNAITSVTA